MGAEQRTDLAWAYVTRKGGAYVSSYALHFISCKDQEYSAVRCSGEEDVGRKSIVGLAMRYWF